MKMFDAAVLTHFFVCLRSCLVCRMVSAIQTPFRSCERPATTTTGTHFISNSGFIQIFLLFFSLEILNMNRHRNKNKRPVVIKFQIDYRLIRESYIFIQKLEKNH